MGNKYDKMTDEQRGKWNKYQRSYARTHFKSFTITLSLTNDKDVIDYIESHGKIVDVVRDLIREKQGNE